MTGYTPLFGEIVNSYIWNEDPPTCKVWVTLMALADMDGNVYGSVAGLAPVARVTLQECEKAIEILSSPDRYSRSPEEEGRRIIPIEGGWHLVNHRKYRQKAKSRADYMRRYREEKKKEQKEKNSNANANSDTQCNITLQGVTCYTLQQVKDACVILGIPESNAQSYYDQYSSQGWKKGNGQEITKLRGHMAKRWNKVRRCWDFDEGKEDSQYTPPVRDSNGKTPLQARMEQTT